MFAQKWTEKWRRFTIKLRHWEYWNFHFFYTPVYLYWIWLSLRARHFLFFTAANPAIETGGFLGESKNHIYEMLPQQFVPQTIFIARNTPFAQVVQQAKVLDFPLIAKPDKGERGFLVEKIDTIEQLEKYHAKTPADFLLQEFLDYSEEVGVLYFRFPRQYKGQVSSLTLKEFLQVTGDGKNNVRGLMMEKDRAFLQIPFFEKHQPELLEYVPAVSEKVALGAIGNHNRGTCFLNGNELIDENLTTVFDALTQNVEGFYYGRFDIKCESIAALKQGKNFRIIELNGVKSEPTHIYQPNYSLLQAYRDIFFHWKTIWRIARINHQNGVAYMSYIEAYQRLRKLRQYWHEVEVAQAKQP